MSGADAVAAARVRSPFARGDAVSASRLEMYATCPYRYFLRYGLGIEQVEEPEAIERMDHLQRGSLIHEILQRFMQAIGRSDPPARVRRAEHLPRLLTIARECGEERVRRGVAGKPLIWERDRREIEEDLVRWYDREADAIAADPALLPGAHEARFGTMPYGGESEDPLLSSDEPLAITVAGRAMRVLGRIDRIDWDDARTRYRVIDYKTGKFSHASGSVLARGDSQLRCTCCRIADAGHPPDDGQAQYFHATGRGTSSVTRSMARRSARAARTSTRCSPRSPMASTAASSPRTRSGGTASGATTRMSATGASTASRSASAPMRAGRRTPRWRRSRERRSAHRRPR
jgi:hypothetical protein